MKKDEIESMCNQLLILPEKVEAEMNRLAGLVNGMRTLDDDLRASEQKTTVLVVEATLNVVVPAKKAGEPDTTKTVKQFPNIELRTAEVAKRLKTDIHYRSLQSEREKKEQLKSESEATLVRLKMRFRAMESVLKLMGGD